MKKVMFLLATLLIGGMMFTGCKKDNPQPTPDTPSTPTETTKTFVYKVNNTFQTMSDVTGALTTHTISPCFHYTFSYKDADGKMVEVTDATVEVTDATLPWTKEISVKTPFEAQLKGKVTYNESEIPTPVFFGTLASIEQSTENHTKPATGKYFEDKEDFLEYIATNPQMLEFNYTLSIN